LITPRALACRAREQELLLLLLSLLLKVLAATFNTLFELSMPDALPHFR
jgi:hypothetical protein